VHAFDQRVDGVLEAVGHGDRLPAVLKRFEQDSSIHLTRGYDLPPENWSRFCESFLA